MKNFTIIEPTPIIIDGKEVVVPKTEKKIRISEIVQKEEKQEQSVNQIKNQVKATRTRIVELQAEELRLTNLLSEIKVNLNFTDEEIAVN